MEIFVVFATIHLTSTQEFALIARHVYHVIKGAVYNVRNR